ncbi:recombinase family protein [uncultured Oscillibacter sp.]|uniref:recombinase family protein n=1 Tax=uncultured Oscillibacter sp. TaxID=876091 RepID=UPI002803D395|nr:recombinase family protein [uncultured Oscillibacter sp.]
MSTVTTVPPTKYIWPEKKVAAYCRVSTHAPEQLVSLAAQERYYEERIRANPYWTFVGIYSDIGSATRKKGRRRFNAMISACRRGKIDLVLTKSAHRFARNTVDALETIRMLRRWNVDIYFEQEDIHSLYESSEFMLTLVCAKAQEESHSKSQDIKWGLQKAFENPDSKYYQRRCYGYTHDADGHLVIDEERAKVVRLIYSLATDGASLSKISDQLKEMGILSPRGKDTWSRETLRKILNNEKYFGTVILQKTLVENFLEHRQFQNNGKSKKYLVVKNHRPIIEGRH